MKLIDVDSKATVEDFLRNVMKKQWQQEWAFAPSCQCKSSDNSFFDEDVKYDKDSVEDSEVPLISELNTGSRKENIFPQISHKDVETYLLKGRSDDNEKMSCYRQFIRGFNFYIILFFKLL
jgi:hypothetical protein